MNKISRVNRVLAGAFLFAIIFNGCALKENVFFEVSYNPELGSQGFDGRLLLMITKDTLKEPRFQINDTNETGILIGKNVQKWVPGQEKFFSS